MPPRLLPVPGRLPASYGVPFIRLLARNRRVENGYRYMVYLFSRWLLLRHGIAITTYDPVAGVVEVTPGIDEDTLWEFYEKFVHEYLVDKVVRVVSTSGLGDVAEFLYPGQAKGRLGLAPVLVHRNMVSGGMPAVSGSVAERIRRLVESASGQISSMGAAEVGFVVPLKDGVRLVRLEPADLARILAARPSHDRVELKGACGYCGASHENLLPAKAGVNVGRIRLPEEGRTSATTSRFYLCPRCYLLAFVAYREVGDDLYVGLSPLRVGEDADAWHIPGIKTETGRVLARLLSRIRSLSLAGADKLLIYSRGYVVVDGFREELAPLALLARAVPVSRLLREREDLLLKYIFARGLVPRLRILLHMYKVVGGSMSYVSRLLPAYLRGGAQTREKVAYALARLAELGLWIIEQSGNDPGRKQYMKRKYGELFAKAGLSKALTYVFSQTRTAVTTLAIKLEDGDDKDLVASVLARYRIPYRVEGDMLKVSVRHLPLLEVGVKADYTQKIFRDAYVFLAVRNPSLETREGGEQGA